MNDATATPVKKKKPFIERPRFMFLYMLTLLVFILVCGYMLIFSGSLLFEGIVKGWYRPEASPEDNNALWISVLTVFPCFLGLIGGIAVLATGTARFHQVKILLFVPAVVWTVQLIIDNLRWGFQYWTQWLFLFPAMFISIFVLYCVVKEVRIPILSAKSTSAGLEDVSAS